MYDTVYVNIKGNFNLWHTTASWSDTIQLEHTELLIVICHRALTLQNTDINRRLVIRSSWEYLRFACWNRCVTWNQHGHDTTHCLNTEAQWCNIQQQNILYITGDNTTLNSSTHSNYFIRVYRFIRFLAQNALNSFLYSRDTGRSTYQQYLVNIIFCQTGIAQCVSYRLHCTLNQRLCHFIKFCTW